MVFIHISQIYKKIGLLLICLMSLQTQNPCWIVLGLATLRGVVGRTDIALCKIYGFFIILYSFSLLPLPLPQKTLPKPHQNHTNPTTMLKGKRRRKCTWGGRPWAWEMWKPLPAYICCNLWGRRICENVDLFRAIPNKCLRGNEKNGRLKEFF